jgi:predicted RNA binding protein YcfA (HicA-like mRNA interferase family)
MKGRPFARRLRKAAVEIIKGRGKGGHVLGCFEGRQTMIPVHGDIDYGPQFLRRICRQLGLDPNEVI